MTSAHSKNKDKICNKKKAKTINVRLGKVIRGQEGALPWKRIDKLPMTAQIHKS